jgi:hypothetical protein
MQSAPLLDRAGRRRSPAILPGYHKGRPPCNKGLALPAGPTDGRGNHRRHARRPREPQRPFSRSGSAGRQCRLPVESRSGPSVCSPLSSDRIAPI